MHKVNVVPLVQVGNVPFGANRDVVRNEFGKYKEFRKNIFSRNTSDDFGFCHVYYDEANKCEAFELFPECTIESSGRIVFPGKIDIALDKFGKFTNVDNCYIDVDNSIGITVSDGEMESILFGKKDYYK